MKKVLFVIILGAFAACGGNTGAEAVGDSTSVTLDSASTGIINPGTTAGEMNADSTTMGENH